MKALLRMVGVALIGMWAAGVCRGTEQRFNFYIWGFSFFEGSTLKHEVRSFSPDELPPDLWFRTRSGTAEEGLDFAHAEGQLTFSRAEFGHAIAPFEIVSMDDAVREGWETFYLQIATEEDFREGSILQELTMYLGDNEVPWILDSSFNPNGISTRLVGSFSPYGGSLNPVNTLAVQPDGKIILGGIISSETGDYRGLVRLHPNGEVDSTFRTGTTLASARKVVVGARGQIYAVAFVSDGSERIVKLDAQGRLLWSKEAHPGHYGLEGLPMLVREDGSILVGGYFTNVAGVERKYLALLDSEGNVLPKFHLELNGAVTAAEQRPDGSIVIGGKFTMVGDQARSRVAVLKKTGELDTSFDAGQLVSQEPTAFAVQGDGKILVSGGFNTNNGAPYNRLMRLNGDGSVDETFRADLDERAYGIAVDEEGKIVIGGAFNRVNGLGRSRLARLLEDGSLDVTYDPGEGPNDRVLGVRINEDGTYLIWGNFHKIERHPMRGVARIFPYSNTVTVDFVDQENFAVEQYREAHVQLQRFGETAGELEVEVSMIPGNEEHLREFAP